MAQITVTADDGRIAHREWVVGLQADSDHFLRCFAERLRWAIRDAEVPPTVSAPSSAEMPAAGEPLATDVPADEQLAPVDIDERRVPALVG